MNRIQSPTQFTKRLFGVGLNVMGIAQGAPALPSATSVLTSSTQLAIAGSCRTVAQDWDGYPRRTNRNYDYYRDYDNYRN